jgi:mRNA-degrading endonuclease RelE of RelBE toxin-antitoxin system
MLMPNEGTPVIIRFTATFKRNVKHLHKKYPQIRQDIDRFIGVLQRGETPGDRILGTRGYIIYKARVRVSGSGKGKSAGYRLIYWLRTPSLIVLLTIYVKSERTDISPSEIRAIVTGYAPQLDEKDSGGPNDADQQSDKQDDRSSTTES